MFYYTLEFEIKQKGKVVAHRRIDADGYNLADVKKNVRNAIEEYINDFHYPGKYRIVYARRWLKSEGVPKKLGNIYK